MLHGEEFHLVDGPYERQHKWLCCWLRGLAARSAPRCIFLRSSLSLACLGATPVCAQAVNEAATTLPSVTVKARTDSGESAAQGYQARSASVGTRTDTPLLEVPQSVNVATREYLRDRAPTALDEALFGISGVKQGNTLGGTQDSIRKRGFGTNRDNSIYRDGMQSVQARNFTPTTERIEVLKGPASMLYGIQDPGGVINVITKKPLLQRQGSVSAWGTSFGGGGAQLDFAGPMGSNGLAYRLIADEQRYDYWRNFGNIRQQVIAPSLAWYGGATNVIAAYEHMEYSVPFDRGTQIDTRTGKVLAIPRARRLDEPFNITSGRSDSLTSRLDHRLSDAWSLRANYGYSSNYYNDYQARAMSVDGVTGQLTRRGDATRDARQDAHAFSATLLGKLRAGGTAHELLMGVDYLRNYRFLGDLIRDRPNNTRFNIYRPVYGQMKLPSMVSAADSDQTDKLRSAALFIQDTAYLGDRWIVTAGLRYDKYDELTGKGRPFRTNTHANDSKAVPRLGITYLLRPQWSVYGSYARSFRPNTSIATPIGDLPPEQGTAWEFGTKWVGEDLTATAAVFDITKSNVQTNVLIDGVYYTRVTGRARSRGFEFDLNGRLTSALSIVASYAYADARTTEDPILKGQPLDGVSRHTASVFLTRGFGTVGAGRLRAGAGMRAFSRWGAGDGRGKVYHLPGGAVADAFVAYEMPMLGQRVNLQFNVKNLFDKTTYTSNSGLGSPAIAMGEPRQFVIRARADF